MILSTCWLGLYYVKTNQFEKARAQLNWCTEHAEANGLFPEQILEDLNYPEFKTEWEEKWWPDSLHVSHPLLPSKGKRGE